MTSNNTPDISISILGKKNQVKEFLRTDPASIVDILVANNLRQWGQRSYRFNSINAQLQLAIQSQTEGLTFYDGFGTTWHIHVPLDILSRIRKRRTLEVGELVPPVEIPPKVLTDLFADFDSVIPVITAKLEKEVEEECGDIWDVTANDPRAPYQEWVEAKKCFWLQDLLDMVCRNRLLKGSAMLPGYFRVYIMDITPGGMLTTGPEAVPVDVTLEALVSRLDQWDSVEHNRRVLAAARERVRAIRHISSQKHHARKAAQLYERILSYHPCSRSNAWASIRLASRKPFQLMETDLSRPSADVMNDAVLQDLKLAASQGQCLALARVSRTF